MKQHGFSLIECMVYCMVLAVLFTTWFHGMVVSYATFAKESKRTIQLSNLYAAYDMLIRDIYQAPAEDKQWKKFNKSEIVWRANDVDVCWLVRDNILVRIEGNYDTKKQVWRNKKQSVAVIGIEKVVFTKCKNKEYISGIACQIVMQNKQTIKENIMLRNGAV